MGNDFYLAHLSREKWGFYSYSKLADIAEFKLRL